PIIPQRPRSLTLQIPHQLTTLLFHLLIDESAIRAVMADRCYRFDASSESLTLPSKMTAEARVASRVRDRVQRFDLSMLVGQCVGVTLRSIGRRVGLGEELTRLCYCNVSFMNRCSWCLSRESGISCRHLEI
ncbi:hypothetical protein PMAYCL1PPCAC_10921, partial [Pristionchus mayeri]